LKFEKFGQTWKSFFTHKLEYLMTIFVKGCASQKTGIVDGKTQQVASTAEIGATCGTIRVPSSRVTYSISGRRDINSRPVSKDLQQI